MATGLNLGSGFSELADPYSLDRPAGGNRISQMAQQTIAGLPQIEQPAPQQPDNKFWTNSITNEFYVNGLTFDQDNDAAVVQAEQLLDKPSVGPPRGEGWRPVNTETFAEIVDKVRNPSMTRLFSKNFGIGVDQLQSLAGSALQLAGAEELGGRIVAAQQEQLAKTAPYQREFTDIESGGDVVDWFVANLGQQGPMLLESLAAAGIGAAIGTATGGPGLGTAGGTLAGLFGKQALKKKILDAAKRYSADKAKGVAPKPADVKILRDAAGYAGAAGGAYLSNYAIGAGDIYGEMREQGIDPDDTAARMQALMGAFPYAAADTLGEYVLASRVFGGIRPRAIPEGATRLQRGAELGRRGAVGFGVGAGIEGTTETAQEAIVMGLSGQDLASDEAVQRFINSFAAGAAVGGTVGGLANLRRGKDASEVTREGTPTNDQETNLLDSSGSATQELGVQPRTVPGQPMAERGFVGDVAPGQFGPQGVIDLGGMTVGEARLRSRTPTGAPLQLEGPPQAPPPVPPGQLALQFAPPAPEGIGFTEQQPPPNTLLSQQMQAAQRRREEELAQQQRQEAELAERERQMNLMEAQREQQIAEEARLAEQRAALPQPPAERPAAPVQLRQPQQLPLFTTREAPVPSRAEGLRRGVGEQPEPLAPIETAPTGRAPRQLALLTPQTGRPTIGALRAAGERLPAQAPAPGAGVDTAKVDAARQRLRAKKGFQRVMLDEDTFYEGQLKNGVPNGEGIYYFSSGDVYIGEFKDGLFSGKGEYLYANGASYVGDFKDGLFNGEGTLTYTNGSTATGRFENGRLVTPPPEPPAPKKRAAKKAAPKKATPKKTTLQRGRRDAVQEPSAAQVSAQPEAEAGQEVGEEVSRQEQATREGEAEQEAVTQATDDEFERVLNRYNALTGTQRNLVARRLGVTREQMPDLLDERTADVNAAIDAVLAPATTPTPTEEPFRQKTLAELEAEAAAQRPLRTETAQATPVAEAVDDAIATIEGDPTYDELVDAADTVMFHAYVDVDNNNKAANAKARKFVEETDFNPQQVQVLNDALVDAINIKGSIELHRTSTGYKPVYAYLVNNSLLPRLTATTSGLPVEDAARLVREDQLSLTNLPDSTAKNVITANPDLIAEEASNTARAQKDDTRESPASRLADAIRKINLSETRLRESTRQQRIADVKDQWEALPDDQRNFVDETGTPLSDYFEGDEPKVTIINGKLRITKQAYTDEQVATFEAEELADIDADPDVMTFEAEERGERTLFDWRSKVDDGRFSRDDGTRITQPLAVGRVRMAVNKFLGKLNIKPRVYIYKDQADLKAKNPRLHQRAAESRPQGDFDSTPAAGFSFGDGNVIIFSDYIATEQQLNFVLAHETLGHFGLRGIIPADKFDALMERIYRENPALQGDVDAAMYNNEGMSRAEAVEEYLSDFAGILDTSIVARVWNAIKGALNKLGVQFGDESARYFISQARKYVRNGNVGVPFEVSAVINRLHDIEYGQVTSGTGRFASSGNLYSDVRTAAEQIHHLGGIPMTVDEAVKWFKGQGVNTVSSFDKFKAKFLSLANFRARENPGAQTMENLIDAMRNRSMSIKVEMNEKLREVLNKSLLGKYWGITEEQLTKLNEAVYAAQRLAVNRFDRTSERSREPLYRFEDGVLVPNQPEIDRLNEMGRITFDQMRNGFEYDVLALEDGKEVTKKERFEGIPDLTEDSIEWKGYNQLRDAMNDIELRLLRARYLSAIAEQDIAFNEVEELMDNKTLTNTDRTFLRRALNKYKSLYTENLTLDENGYVNLDADAMTRGNDFLVALNQAILGKDTDLTDKLVAEFFTGKVADDFATQLNDFKTRLKLPEGDKFIVQNRVKQLVLSEMANTDADLFTRRSIATGYTPVLREGTHQIRVEAISPQTGKRVELKQSSRDRLVYAQFDSPKAAMDAADSVNGVFGDNTYDVEAYDQDTGEYVIRKVKLRAVPEAALDSVAAPPELNLNEFVRGLRQFDIALTPSKMETVVEALTRQNNAARNRLERAFVAGADKDATAAISRHIESRASTIAKTELRPRMAELMNLNLSKTQRLWNGDADLLQRLEETAEQVQADPNISDEAKVLARKEFERYKFMYETTNPKGGVRRGMEYYNEASRTAAFLDGNRNVDESDFGSGPLVSFIRAATSLVQLGGSIATGFLNIVGAYTNGLPYLATYNRKNGFGGGFGMGPAVAQFHIAMKDVGGIGMNPFSETSRAANRAEFYDLVANNTDLQERYNLKAHEARFIAREIREGTMIPAQSNALVGTSRGRATKGWQQKFIDGWMMPFNLTEQGSRRSLGLAAYRLEYKQQIGAGKSEAEAEAAARKFAVGTLQLTLGEYSVLNRPPAWRAGIQSFIYMYKVFPTTSIQLLANLPRSGQIAMLSGLFILSGLSGLPFAENIEDIIDTLSQKLGFRSGSIRFEIAKKIDELMPGMSPYILTGLVNSVSVGNVGIRTSLGAPFPGTGALLSGANTSRELMDIAGPAASAITGTVKTAYDIARLPFSDNVTLTDVARESPITIARAFGDAYAYAQSGAIIDRRGYMVSDDMTMATIASRILGFYPTAAADQYSMIRIAKRMTDYQRDVSVGFRTAWINAMQTGDRQRARRIEENVREWNEGARGTALEIRNFRTNAQRALREARRPAGERTLRSSPRAARDDIERISTLVGY